MQCVVVLVLLLAACEPLLVKANKVVFMIPRHVRRINGPPPRYNRPQVPPPYLKSSIFENSRFRNHESTIHENPEHGFYFNGRANFKEEPFPHGGDDFDQNPEEVNHVVIPHGKGITHGVSFGKGYVPYEDIKEYLSSGNNEYMDEENKHHFELDHDEESYSSTGPDYGVPYSTEPSGPFFPDATEDNSGFEIQDRSRNNFMEKKSLTSKSLEGSTSRTNHEEATMSPKDNVPAGSENELSTIFDGTKGTVVAQDTLSLTDYDRKVKELTKTWPGPINFDSRLGFGLGNNFGSGINSFSASALPAVGFQAGSTWLKFPGEQGYAVKEDTMEEPYDFRTMPISTTTLQPLPIPTTLTLPTYPNVLQG